MSRFVKIIGQNKFFTDAMGAFRGVILNCSDCGKVGVAINAVGGQLTGEVFAYYVDNNNVMQRRSNPVAFNVTSRKVADYVQPQFAY